MANIFFDNIEKDTIENNNYRHVLYTGPDRNLQLVVMSLKPKEEIGKERHPKTTQFIRIEKGNGIALVDNMEINLKDGSVVIIPPNIWHNIINNGNSDLKLYTIYTPAEHPDKLIQVNKPQQNKKYSFKNL